MLSIWFSPLNPYTVNAKLIEGIIEKLDPVETPEILSINFLERVFPDLITEAKKIYGTSHVSSINTDPFSDTIFSNALISSQSLYASSINIFYKVAKLSLGEIVLISLDPFKSRVKPLKSDSKTSDHL